MPYYVHPHGIDPIGADGAPTVESFPTKRLAVAERQRLLDQIPTIPIAISYVASSEELSDWYDRESERFRDGTYLEVPWRHRLRHTEGHGTLIYHYAHMSRKIDGMIAYTPDDQHGHEDRQVRTTAARYLNQFCGGIFSPAEREIFSGQTLPAEVRFATTADKIGAVYATERYTFESCMGPRYHAGRWPFNDPSAHPARAYASGDLAVAYLGSPESGILARTLVVPDEKKYIRCFGDHVRLSGALENMGYTRDENAHDGKRIAVIPRESGGYWFPYVDNIAYAELVRQKGASWFVLRDVEESDADGLYPVMNTSGYTLNPVEVDEPEEAFYCQHCDNEREDEDAAYCHSCLEDLRSCDSCGTESFDSDSFYYHDRGTLCESCEADESHECMHCDESFSAWDFSSRHARARNMDLCQSCEDDGISPCPVCEDYSDPDTWFAGNRVCSARCPDCRESWLEARRVRARERGRVLRAHSTDRSARHVA